MSAPFLVNRFENLEPRFLLAGFASVNAAGVLSVVGTSQSNVINVAYSGSNIKVTRDGASLSFDKSKVNAIWAEAYGGNDKITIGVPLPSTLIGDAGDDTLIGNAGDDEIHGGSGNDRLTGAGGGNSLDTGGENDVIDYSAQQAGEFVLEGEPPYAYINHVVNGVTVSIDTFSEQATHSRMTILLTPGNDTLYANGDFDCIIDGGSGDDKIEGIHDSVYGFVGGPGNDTFWLTDEFNLSFIDGGQGNDVIDDRGGISGPKVCNGGSGYDSYSLSFIPDQSYLDQDVTVPPGIEAFNVSLGADLVVHGNDLDNNITATANQVTLYGNGGNDKLTSLRSPIYFGSHLLDGGSGNDTLSSAMDSAANDVFKGGSGNDTADFSAETDDLNISLDNVENDGAAFTHVNVQSDIENVIGGSGNDKITGSSSNNILRGGKGNDSLYGGGGADALFGDAGDDLLDGGTGSDYLQGFTGKDALFGRDGNDKLDAGDGDDYLEGNAGNDSMLAGAGNDKLYGGAGDDSLYGGSGNDTLYGDAGHDKLFGESGNDSLFAKDGQTDTLDGGTGTDKAQRDNSSTTKDSVLNIESFI